MNENILSYMSYSLNSSKGDSMGGLYRGATILDAKRGSLDLAHVGHF